MTTTTSSASAGAAKPEQGELILTSEFSTLSVHVSATTGLPTALSRSDGPQTRVELIASALLLTGGQDRRGPLGRLEYDDARSSDAVVAAGEPTSRLVRGGRVFTIPVRLSGWAGEIRYTFRMSTPQLEWSWSWWPAEGAEDLREFVLDLRVRTAAKGEWSVDIPGATIRSDAPLEALAPSTTVPTMGGVFGSSAIIALTHTPSDASVIVWPRSHDEIGALSFVVDEETAGVEYWTNVAGVAAPGNRLDFETVAIDLVVDPDPLRNSSRWYRRAGITTPIDRPAWTRGATIYEAQIGTSIFGGGTWTYSPYPEASDLLADLPRIHALGFDTIQIMPRQPFPSYNVIDYDDVDASYGAEEDIRRIVAWSHDHGMRVILDVLLHGVIDRESFRDVVDAVRRGPWAERITSTADEIRALGISSEQVYDLAWSRHILDFEEAWLSGSPERHALADEHPEWFCRDSRGKIIGIYTKAFDMSHPGWQRYFSDKMIALIDRLDIDGFRFDAPGYNEFPNWSPRSATRPGLQTLGAVELFDHLRETLHDKDPELMMYTEPSGPLWRQALDINYNYDEAWLLDSVAGSGGDNPESRVRNGSELALWMHRRDRSLPPGSVTAHHIDSHDSFWWPLPGEKWRREQFGLDGARGFMTLFALLGGPYMMFVGGEVGLEDAIEQVNRLRRSQPELASGEHHYGVPSVAADIFSVSHSLNGVVHSVLLVNVSRDAASAEVALTALGAAPWTDALSGDRFEGATGTTRIEFQPFQARFLTREVLPA
ncbi:alpha-amylase family glycosyl hydrolase [Leifsonia sp. AG29]|uniref:alpha-amylase family glycosyl hydrolase n=1 Tax=Leifsonia sp. AG29 TaxID=2598860 RepID=UPI00131AB5FC|nr:alpha-amylase family glycosyl hydrolase [Leifsonia sp. AG29]